MLLNFKIQLKNPNFHINPRVTFQKTLSLKMKKLQNLQKFPFDVLFPKLSCKGMTFFHAKYSQKRVCLPSKNVKKQFKESAKMLLNHH